MAFGKIIGRRKKTEIMLSADVAFEPENSDVGVFVSITVKVPASRRKNVIRIIKPFLPAIEQFLPFVLRIISRRIVRRIQNSESVFAASAGQFGGDVGVNDGARVDEIQTALKNVYSFEKERTFFLKEDRETHIGGRNRRVGFDLCEIGIVCKIERDRRRQTEFRGHPEFGFQTVIDDNARSGRRQNVKRVRLLF